MSKSTRKTGLVTAGRIHHGVTAEKGLPPRDIQKLHGRETNHHAILPQDDCTILLGKVMAETLIWRTFVVAPVERFHPTTIPLGKPRHAPDLHIDGTHNAPASTYGTPANSERPPSNETV